METTTKERNLQAGQTLQQPQGRRDGAGKLVTMQVPAPPPPQPPVPHTKRRQTPEPEPAIQKWEIITATGEEVTA